MYCNGIVNIFFVQAICFIYCVRTFLILPPKQSQLSDLKKYTSKPATADIPGEPLFLTPYIEAGLIKEGQNASRVPSLLSDNTNEEGNTTEALESYSGFLTVNKEWNSNLFFWFFPNERKIRNAPVLLWLQGGPGGSSLYGLFTENGPYGVNRTSSIVKRKYTWTKHFNVLYIDQPVGTGFSFTQAAEGYARNQKDVCRDLYPALIQFFQLFPEYASNDFYLTGESYAGKYIPAIATEIHRRRNKENDENGSSKINLKGLLIGNGWTDPENMMVYGDYLYQLGFVDTTTLKKIHEYEHMARTQIRSKRYKTAHAYWGMVLRASPVENVYDYTKLQSVPLSGLAKTISSDAVRRAIHVGNFEYDAINYRVYYAMQDDMMQTVAPLFGELLRHYRILLYNGQFDVIVAYPLTKNFLQNLHFDGALEYQKTVSKPWRDNDRLVAGYWKSVGNLTEILIRNAGHMAPADQPKWTYQMVRGFIDGNQFT